MSKEKQAPIIVAEADRDTQTLAGFALRMENQDDETVAAEFAKMLSEARNEDAKKKEFVGGKKAKSQPNEK